jgi:hypothetical protein
MSEGFHGCTFGEEIFDCTFRLDFKYFDSNNSFSPKSLINNAISSFRDLTLKSELIKIDLEIAGKDSRLYSKLIKDILLFYATEGQFACRGTSWFLLDFLGVGIFFFLFNLNGTHEFLVLGL